MQISGSFPVPDVSKVVQGSVGGASDSKSSFSETLKDAVENVDRLQTDAANKIGELLAGNGQDVHSAMISVQQSNLSFELMVQVRNKMVSAYQEISRLQF